MWPFFVPVYHEIAKDSPQEQADWLALVITNKFILLQVNRFYEQLNNWGNPGLLVCVHWVPRLPIIAHHYTTT
jgi:hypothetical protein